MKKTVVLLFPLIVLFVMSCPPQRSLVKESEQRLYYTIALDSTEGTYQFKVNFRLQGDFSGLTKVYTPSEWGPATSLNENIKKVKVKNASIEEQTDRYLLLRHAPGASISVNYIVQSLPKYPVDNPDEMFHPILQKDFFQFYGNGVFFYPADLNKIERPVNIYWEGFPEDWVIHNSYGSNQRKQSFRWRDSLWLESIFVGGDYRIHKIEIADDPVYVAMRGEEWRFSDDEYLDLLKKVITQQRKFWNDYDFDYFTVTLAPFMEGQNYGSYQGTGLRNSFALNATPKVGLKNFEYLFSHELMHEWIGLQIKTADPEAYRYWFSEGFTDYFTYINMRECGLISEEGYLWQINNVVKKYYKSAVREATNEELAANFFTDYSNYGKLAYNRGCVFAMYTDWKIRLDSKGEHRLKDVMQEFLNVCRHGKQRLTDELFLKTVNQYLEKPIDSYFEKHIQNGALIPLEDWMLGAKTEIREENGIPQFVVK